MKDLAILISLFNPDKKHLIEVLNEFSDMDVYLADDNPNSDFDTQILKKLKKTVYFKNAKNLGIAASLNNILKKFTAFKYIFFLDQDTKISRSELQSHYLKFQNIESNNKIGIGVGSYHYSKKYQYVFKKSLGLGVYPNDSNITPRVYYANLSGLLVDFAKMKRVGFFDTALFMDYVDVEFGYRANNCGYRVYINNNIILNHKIGDIVLRLPVLNRLLSIHRPSRMINIYKNLCKVFFGNYPYIKFAFKLSQLVKLLIKLPLNLIFLILFKLNLFEKYKT